MLTTAAYAHRSARASLLETVVTLPLLRDAWWMSFSIGCASRNVDTRAVHYPPDLIFIGDSTATPIASACVGAIIFDDTLCGRHLWVFCTCILAPFDRSAIPQPHLRFLSVGLLLTR
jgi:hypothetical protein